MVCPGGTCDLKTYRCVYDAGATGGASGAGGVGGMGGLGGMAGAGGVRDAGVDMTVDKGPPPCSVVANTCASDKPVCDSRTGACRTCGEQPEDCRTLNPALPVCITAGVGGGVCVECGAMSDCGGKTPVCTAAHTCAACRADTDCATIGAHVCMTDGHCATTDQAVIVDEASGCADAGANGTFCTLASAVAALSPSRNVLIVVGGTSDRLTLATVNVKPVVIGRKNAAGDPGSIPATTGTAVTVSSDSVLIRDLTVNLGGSSTSRGIAITGAATTATILRVTASLGTGLGIDVENGASVTIDESYVTGNSAGGILVNGATAIVQNSVIASNVGSTAYGIQFNNAGAGTKFWFNTVVKNPVAAVCSFGGGIYLQNSILEGPQTNCTPVNSTNVVPTFNTALPYHLIAHDQQCGAPSSFPGYDIDGESRPSSPDCGADQFVMK